MNPRHCIKVDDFSQNELIDLFELTAELKHKYRTKEDFKPFRNHSMAMIFAKPSASTLKTSLDGQTISTTIDRSEIWEAETPQIFNFKKLYNAYDSHKNDISLLTDESSLFDELDDQIIFYETTSKNIKITYKEDLKLAEYLLRTIED